MLDAWQALVTVAGDTGSVVPRVLGGGRMVSFRADVLAEDVLGAER